MWPFGAWTHIAQTKRHTQESLLRSANPIALGSRQEAFLRATATEIVQHIQAGEWTSSEVLEAYIARTIETHRITNCLTEILFDEAREQAKALDAEFATTRQLRGPLHGVPVSFKDLIDIKGYDSTIGYTSYANKPKAEDAHLVKLVRSAGGIPFVKTNVPQTMLTPECYNPVWGRTVNPHDTRFTTGGSTGGESALLATDGSALGWGSDIGGSIRSPAAFCGVYSIKPSLGRISKGGITACLPGFKGIPDVLAPMARSVQDLKVACGVVFAPQRDSPDYDYVPLGYRATQLSKKLRFGYYVSDGLVKGSPACRRAILETVDALERDGHGCVEIVVPEPTKPAELFAAFTGADSHATLLAPVRAGGDPVVPELALKLIGPRLFRWMHSLVAWVMRNILGDSIFATVFSRSRTYTVAEYWALEVEKERYARLFQTEVWDKFELDGIIAPVYPMPQLPNGVGKDILAASNATILYNILNCSVGIVPVTHVDASRDKHTEEWSNPKAGKGHGSWIMEWYLYGKHGYYDAEKMDGLPVGVQVVGRRYEEEKVLEMMDLIDRALGPRGFGPGNWKGQKGAHA